MAIKVGDTLPDVKVMKAGAEGPEEVSTHALFGGQKAVLFAVPGAFTPTCSAQHLPSYLTHTDDLKAKGVGLIACVSVNDAFVMSAWSQSEKAGDSVVMLADGNAALTKALGLELDASGFGMGTRSQRYSMLLNDNKVEALYVDEGGGFKVSGADHMLANM
ncbi:MAG: peroxiredoxin [Pseudomonadota bacterium]